MEWVNQATLFISVVTITALSTSLILSLSNKGD